MFVDGGDEQNEEKDKRVVFAQGRAAK